MPKPEATPQSQSEKSLDLVQRVIVSAIVVAVFGGLTCFLAGLTALRRSTMDSISAVGLWIMSGVLGLLTAGAVLVINRRHPYHPLVLLGLLPLATAAYWVLR